MKMMYLMFTHYVFDVDVTDRDEFSKQMLTAAIARR
jgi:hypothetical protein